MKLKKIFNASLLCVALGLSSLAQATPYTYVFNAPDWSYNNNSELLGTSSVLSITVENGNVSSASQSYLLSHITGISLKTIGGTYEHTWSNFTIDPQFDPIYLFTNDNGVATLDLSENLGSFVAYDSSGHTLDFYAKQAFRIWGADGGDSAAYTSGFKITSKDNNVPEPTSLALLGLALAGLGVTRKRRQA